MSVYPHVPAAFINNIAEEGSKVEAVKALQETWNELCAVRNLNDELQDKLAASEKEAAHRNAAMKNLQEGLAASEAAREKLEEALRRLETWRQAYPLGVFPEPDFKKARELLEAGGMTLDAISASNMRHVIEQVGKIIDDALASPPAQAGASEDKCANCGFPKSEHHYNGACYGLCGKFIAPPRQRKID